MLKHITLGLNTLQPETWTRHDVEDVCAFLKEQFGEQFPDTARIYHGSVDLPNDVTPGNEKDIERLQSLPGPFYVMVYPGWVALPYIFAVVLAVASYLLAPSPTAAPVVAQRNTTASSPNNELSDRSNKARPNARIPDIYGTVRSTPDLIAAPYKVFENGREVEYAYMCIGRGEYEVTQLASGEFDVRDGDTLISNITGSSVAIYAPYTSPNSGDDPQMQFGNAISAPVLSTRRSNSVNGQVLRPPNAATFVGDGDIRFVWPNIIERPAYGGRDFSTYFVDGDSITLTGATLSASSTVTENHYVTIYAADNPTYLIFKDAIVIATQGTELSLNYSAGASIDITDLYFATPVPGFDSTLDLSGTYVIESVSVSVGFDYSTGGTILYYTVKLVNPSAVNSDWADIGTVGSAIIKYLSIDIGNPTLAFDLDGTYEAVSVSASQIVLNNPSSVTTDWDLLETPVSSPYLSPTITTAESYKWYGPFFLDDIELTSVIANFVAQNGLYKDDGTTQTAAGVVIQLELTPVNSAFEDTGDPQYFNLTMLGSSTLKETVAATLSAYPTFTGRCRVRAARLTPNDTAFTGTVIDEVRWRDIYSVSPVDDLNFGNVTTVHSKTYATSSALAVKDRRLNMEVTRKLPAYIPTDDTFTTELYASNSAADIFCAVCLDPYIGRRLIAELDAANIYDTLSDVETEFGSVKATEFSYTFDSDNMSFEETANAISEAVFCTAFRRGNVIKWSFEKATDASTLLFNHRNKLPGSETRTVNFGFNNDNDGVEYKYVDPDDDAVMSAYLPEDTPTANAKVVESIGVRNHLQAYFHIWRIWNRIRYQHTATEFDATAEADILVRNERILNTDGTRPYTRDGEITAVDGLNLTLSQPVNDSYVITTEDGDDITTEDGDTLITESGDLIIWLQHTDGIAESIPITIGADQYHVVLEYAPRLPLVTDKAMYARTGYIIVGGDTSHEMAFLVTEKSASENMTSTVKAVNYDARYYEHDTDYINDLIDLDGYGPRGGHVTVDDPDIGPGSA